jgi:hypothetical protein
VLHTIVRSGARTHLLSGYSTQLPDVHHTVLRSGGRTYILDGYSSQTIDVVANYIGRGMSEVAALAVDRQTPEEGELSTPTRRLALAVAALPPIEDEDDDEVEAQRFYGAEVLGLLSLADWQEATTGGDRAEEVSEPVRFGPVEGPLAEGLVVPEPAGFDAASWPAGQAFEALFGEAL